MVVPRPARVLRQAQCLPNGVAHTSSKTRAFSALTYRSSSSSDQSQNAAETFSRSSQPPSRRSRRLLSTERAVMLDRIEELGQAGPSRRSEDWLSTVGPPPVSDASDAMNRATRRPSNDMEDEEEDGERRDERRSPAAVLGSKRIGSVVLPEELIDGIETAITEIDPKIMRQRFLNLAQEPGPSRNRHAYKGGIPESEVPMAKAAGFLSGQYAAVRNVLEEMESRLGRGWLGHLRTPSPQFEEAENGATEKSAQIVEITGGMAPGMWALLDAQNHLPSLREADGLGEPSSPFHYQLIHGSTLDTKAMKRIMQDVPREYIDVTWLKRYEKDAAPKSPSLVMSTFHLSTLLPADRQRHLKHLLSMNSQYTIIVDHASRESWEAISEARSWLLNRSTAENPLHVVAPCPHDQACPMAGTREVCGYTQRLQTPSFLRRTKHHKRGEENKGYCYLVIGRGKRPMSAETESPTSNALRNAGLVGGVSKDEAQRLFAKLEGKHVLRPVEGDRQAEDPHYEMIPLAEDQAKAGAMPEAGEFTSQNQMDTEELSNRLATVDNEAMLAQLRQDAYSWPRLVAPPIKKSGHVLMDVCDPNGKIQRMTIPRSHSKQGYHDARKSHWGDLFPHQPKGKVVVRDRGVRRLMPEEILEGEEGENILAEILGTPDQGSDVFSDELVKTTETPPRRLKKGERREGDFRQPKDKKTRDLSVYDVRDDVSEIRAEILKDPAPSSSKGKKGKKEKGKALDDNVDFEDTSMAHFEKIRDGNGEVIGYASISAEGSNTNQPPRLPGDDEVTIVKANPEGSSTATVTVDGKEVSRSVHSAEEKKQAHEELLKEEWYRNIVRVTEEERGKVQPETQAEPQGKRGPLGQSKRSFGSWARPRLGLDVSIAPLTMRRGMSVRPREKTNGNGNGTVASPRTKVTISELRRLREKGEPISVLTAYDYPTALFSEAAGVDIVLVGDSLSQVALGHEETSQITLDEMIHHCKAVSRGAKTPFLIADMPFGSFESSVEKGVESVLRMVKEGGVDGVKIEGGEEIIPLVQRLEAFGIPVMPHLGLRPQRATSTSGYLVQGRSAEGSEELYRQALAMEAAGASFILFEAIPHPLATYLTSQLSVPTIGIGAGPGTSGQVLVVTDVLGVYADPAVAGDHSRAARQPRFVRQFGNVGTEARRAIEDYVKHVKDGSFPEVGKETYGMKDEEWDAFMARRSASGQS